MDVDQITMVFQQLAEAGNGLVWFFIQDMVYTAKTVRTEPVGYVRCLSALTVQGGPPATGGSDRQQ